MSESNDGFTSTTNIRRRTVLTAGAGLVLGAAASSVGAASASAATSPIPKLAGEVSRTKTQYSLFTGKPYEDVLVSINGDPARIRIPWTAVPHSTKPIAVVWFYHATGSDHNSLTYVFGRDSQLCLDQGAVTICQKARGDLYSAPAAQQSQRDGWAYLSSQFTIGVNYLRANSGGGARACSTYGAQLMPFVRGMYLASCVYDMEKAYVASPTDIGPAYGNDVALIASTNPARIDVANWAGARVRIAAAADSNPDPIVPASQHGGALLKKIAPVAVEASGRYYTTGGHQIPSWVGSDMMAAFQRWL